MKRWLILLLALTLLPKKGMELGNMIPVAVLQLEIENEEIVLKTDTEDTGRAETLSKAIANLKESANGILLLDTVEDIILSKECEYLLPQLKTEMRSSVRVCNGEGEMNLKEAWQFLRTHKPVNSLKETGNLQTLVYEGRFRIGS